MYAKRCKGNSWNIVILVILCSNSMLFESLNIRTSKQLVFENGVVCGVIVGDKAARSPVVIGDSTWFRDDRQKKTGKCIRSICILNHPIDGCESGKSAVIGFFRKQLIKAGYKPRESDINGLCLSWKMNVCPKGIYVAVFSTTVETQKAEKELKIVYDLLGTVLEQFDSVTTLYRPKKATKKQGIFIFSTPDASVYVMILVLYIELSIVQRRM